MYMDGFGTAVESPGGGDAFAHVFGVRVHMIVFGYHVFVTDFQTSLPLFIKRGRQAGGQKDSHDMPV